MNPDKINRAGKILILIGGISLAILYFASALGLIGPPTDLTMILTGIVVLIYVVEDFTGKTYEQGYKDGIDLVLTGMPDTAREVLTSLTDPQDKP